MAGAADSTPDLPPTERRAPLPALKSAKKSLRKSRQRRLRNRSVLSTMRTAVKRVRQASDAQAGQSALADAISVIDRTVRKGVLQANTAARHKSRLTRHVKNLG